MDVASRPSTAIDANATDATVSSLDALRIVDAGIPAEVLEDAISSTDASVRVVAEQDASLATGKDAVTEPGEVSLAELFRTSAPAPQHETDLRPIVKKVFGNREFRLECRGLVCRISQPPNTVPEADWANAIQSETESLGIFTAMLIRGGSKIVVFAKLAETPSNQLLAQVVSAVKQRDPDVDRCKQSYPSNAAIGFRISLDNTRHLSVTVTGSTGSMREQCLKQIFEGAVIKIDVPVDVRTMTPWTFLVPAE